MLSSLGLAVMLQPLAPAAAVCAGMASCILLQGYCSVCSGDRSGKINFQPKTEPRIVSYYDTTTIIKYHPLLVVADLDVTVQLLHAKWYMGT